MQFPANVSFLLSRLHSAGYSAYAVGGCVRDTLMGKEPKDWDLCTSALPQQMMEVFSDERLITNGLKHGTLAVVLQHIPYEITTYRLDGLYRDHRHPDSVSFVDQIELDLSRRDFTVNAMAFSIRGELVDLFHGREDLQHGIIRCVGDPQKRFEEDALRILRALRFASVLDFHLDPATEEAVRQLYPSLGRIAAERIRSELVSLLCGPGAGRILRGFPEIFVFLIPCLKPTLNYQQDNPHHLYTVWEHTVRAVETVPPDPVLRLTMLLHDCGKPVVRTTDANGIGHYLGHQSESARLAADTLSALRFDRATSERIIRLIAAHDIPLSTDKMHLLRRLNQFGESDLRALFQIHRADRIATGTRNPIHASEHCADLNASLDALLAEKPCYTLKDLQVDGNDLLSIGYHGKEIGKKLNDLLSRVMNGDLPNERQELLDAARIT